ncbi:MAG: DUF4258 domain-containing protein [Nitrosomonadales bacterium]|nr:DUF4258 domain-containing protein [Nitrosomonadales bacterium]
MTDRYKLIYRQHAVKRMHERSITEQEVADAIASGAVIESYPNDTPYPSALLLGMAGTKAIHVVYADANEDGIRIIITVYEPDAAIWHGDFRTRR